MDSLLEAIETTPIIDHHAHNLLTAANINTYDSLTITTEAHGPALKQTPSTLAHLRAVKDLAQVLECEPTWEAVQKAIELKRKDPDDAWSRRCFQGIETALIDDGLDPSNVHPYDWHNRLTRSKCKRIVRIERIVENIVMERSKNFSKSEHGAFGNDIVDQFKAAIQEALKDPEVVGFKSVICYRVGLAIQGFDKHVEGAMKSILESSNAEESYRLEDEKLSPYFVHLTAMMIERSKSKKPFQFHTGLGDNDIDLGLSNPAHLQGFIENYPTVPIILLHASYPFTTQAGYLASAYDNCYMDVGEVFPMVSQDGQEKIIREALELCPSEKLTWSTDGHWFPETYLLAVRQVREAMQHVLCEYAERETLTATEAVKVVQDVFFNTSNRLYKLGLPLLPIQVLDELSIDPKDSSLGWADNLTHLRKLLRKDPSIQFLQLQWLDYTSTPRARVLPIKRAVRMFSEKKFVGITKAVLGLLQTDTLAPGWVASGEYNAYPCFEGLRPGGRKAYATVPIEFQEHNGDEVPICPRTLLRRQVEKAESQGIEFLVGFEVEIVFMSREKVEGGFQYGSIPVNEGGHAWSTAHALRPDYIMDLLEEIIQKLENAGIEIEQFHPESSPGQYEFILPPLPPLLSVDTLIAAREIISLVAANAGLRATLFPKPAPAHAGTGAHVHISLTKSSEKWQSFYAGILKHLKAIAAFTYSQDASYERVVDGVWAGSTYICWGTQNREAPLRRIEGSHFEIKCMDGLANPYLALSAIFGAGMLSVKDKQPLTMKDCHPDPSSISAKEREEIGIEDRFPKGIEQALENLEADKQLWEILEPAGDTYCRVKRAEKEMLDGMEEGERRRWLIERY